MGCIVGRCLRIQGSDHTGAPSPEQQELDLGSEPFQGGELWRPLLAVGVQSSSWKEKTAGFTLLIQSENCLVSWS